MNYPEMIPRNIKFATFKDGIHPLVIIIKQPIVSSHNRSLGMAYWGNILLFKELLGNERTSSYLNSIGKFCDRRYAKINIIDEPAVYLDINDPFIKSILNKRKSEQLSEDQTCKIYRYLKYLSYIPLIVNNLASSLIALEAIDNLEIEISKCLIIDRPLPLFDRMKPNSKLFLEYFDKFGLDYIEES